MDGNNKGARRWRLLALCGCGLLVNVLGPALVGWLNLPLYLDNIGSALAAALGGYIPGIVVGFLTNLVNGIGNYETVYYGSLTVLIAICSAWFARRGYYEKPLKLPLIVLVFALIGGGLGSVLTWTLYGFDFGSGVSAPLARRIFSMGGLNEFGSQLAADMLVDLADKAITVAVVAVVLNTLPRRLKDSFAFTGWQQAPLSRKKLAAADRKRARRVSLRSKIIFLVAAAMVIIAAVVTAISFIHYRNAAIDEQIGLARGVVNVAADAVDADRVDEFIERGAEAEGYDIIDRHLNSLANSAGSVEYVYVYKIMEDGCHVVFDADTEALPGSAPGDVIEFDDAFRQYLPTLLAGGEIQPIISNDKYGWLLTVYKPVYDSRGVCRCYAGVDVNMAQITASGYQFLARVVSLFFGFFLLILTVAIWLAEYNIILPINSMDIATGAAAYGTEEARADTVRRIRELDIRTGDEIENLYRSVVRTTEDMVGTVENAERQNETINRAIDTVSEADSGYLKEARNLANYHHEKWNGTGYPCGMKGEEIPLSARIMAVADVFDALVSRRPYKEGFPFEQAMDIIRDGAGTHFDPNVAAAFLHAQDEVREVSRH